MDLQDKPNQSISEKWPTQIGHHELVYNLLFFLLHCIIDIVVLLQNIDNLKYITAKLVIDLIIMILVISFYSRVNQFQVNMFLTITKVSSLIIIVIIGQDAIMLIVFIYEINNVQELKKEQLFQRIITKIGGLVVIIIISSTLDIIIISFLLILEMYNLNFYFKSRRFFQSQRGYVQSRNQRDHSFFGQIEWINKIQFMPIGIILFTIKDLKIIFSNQICFQYFNGQCKDTSQLQTLVLDNVLFQIVKQKENELIAKTSQKIKLKEVEPQKDQEKETIFLTDNKLTLRSILQAYQEGRYLNSLNKFTSSLELQCQQCWDQSRQFDLSFYNCQLNINLEEGEIQLLILDITQYHHFQVDLIQDQFKTQIVQSFSHELRTPLNSACNFLQCCISDKNVPKETKQNLIKPAYNALRLQSHLINDIIDFNCLYVNDIELEFKEFFIKDLIHEVNQLFKSSIQMKQLALYVDLFENCIHTLTSDFSRLMQIIVNIIQNSIKYSNKGTIILKLTSFTSNSVKFTIRDEGVGISEEKLIQILQMLQGIEKKSGFQKYKKWNGFGLLISQMLIAKLSPKNFKSLLIKSEGRNKGTKTSFYVQNQSNSGSSSSSSGCKKRNMIRQMNKVSFQSITKLMSINGTIIQISDLMASYRNLNQMKNPISNENSMPTDSNLQNDLDQKMNNLNHVRPSLITDIVSDMQNMDSPQFKSVQDNQSKKVLSYKKLKQKDEYENDYLIKQIFKKRKCKCKRILSVDDEIFNQKSIQYLLSQQGFEVILAFNGEEALKLVNDIERCSITCNLFMLILMDYQMPIMDGIQTTKTLCLMMLQMVIPQIFIVGLTAFTSKKDVQNCIDAGMSDVLAKPFKIKEFLEIMNLL